MLDSVLVANRGEIACRIIDTCARLGVRTVAVYSDADAGEPHVTAADEAVRLGPAPAADSYLDVDRIIDAARRTDVQGLHPGYGFLSENPRLAAACEDAGLVFVGPDAGTIALMGDKAAAKQHLADAGVPVIPGVDDDELDDEALAEAARSMGMPVLIKPVAGGGGKGMRAVDDPGQLPDALAAARREAAKAFDDDRLIIERLLEEPRHVEIQILGDEHGNVVHVLERECSVQRRHQKIIEETPSPAVDDDLRERMGGVAVTAAEAVGYTNAGTVEMLLDAAADDFYFLEMNTRLQVEHPVTEAVTGLDIVEQQLRIAAGEPLGLEQEAIHADGHALEARLYAEDPAEGFLPQTGRVVAAELPAGDGVRVDGGIAAGSRVSRHYDPMLAKVVVHADDRDDSIRRMRRVLGRTAVLGVRTNREFLSAVVEHPAFRSGDLTTTFVDDHLAGWEPDATPPEVLAAAAVGLRRLRDGPASGDPTSPWDRIGPWRTAGVGGWRLRLKDRGRDHDLVVRRRPDRPATHVELDGTTVTVGAVRAAGTGAGGPDAARLQLQVDGRELPVVVAVDGDDLWVHADGLTRRLGVVPNARHARPGAAAAGALTAPMPGAVLSVSVAVGDEVTAGTTLMVVEAMKMEHPIVAPADGTVTAVHAGAGDGVEADQALLEIEAHDDAGDDTGNGGQPP